MYPSISHGAATSYAMGFVYAYGYLGIFTLLMLGIVGVPIPDEWLLAFAGYLVFKGHFRIAPTLTAAVLGSVCGISVSCCLGRALGIAFVRKYGRWFRITEDKLEQLHAWFGRAGRWSLLVGYFLPGFRHLAGFLAGTSRLRFREFALFAYTGAFLWSSTYVLIGYFFGREWAGFKRTILHGIPDGVVLSGILAIACLLAWKKADGRK